MREREKAPRPRHRRLGFVKPRTRVTARDGDDRFEVQQRDDSGLVRRMLFATEREALAFAESLAYWLGRRAQPGSVQIVWPAARRQL